MSGVLKDQCNSEFLILLSRVFDEHIGVEDVDVVEDMGGDEGRREESRGGRMIDSIGRSFFSYWIRLGGSISSEIRPTSITTYEISNNPYWAASSISSLNALEAELSSLGFCTLMLGRYGSRRTYVCVANFHAN